MWVGNGEIFSAVKLITALSVNWQEARLYRHHFFFLVFADFFHIHSIRIGYFLQLILQQFVLILGDFFFFFLSFQPFQSVTTFITDSNLTFFNTAVYYF